MSDWEIKNVIDYSANGDDIDTFSQKVKAEEEVLYDRLNRVRCNDASSGSTVSDVVPYQWKIDTSTEPATIYMYDGQSEALVKIGTVAESFGYTADDFDGVVNNGGITTMQMGKDAEKPTTAKTRALYFAYDVKKIYLWSGSAWEVFLSLDYDDLLDTENNVITWDDVALNGANKVAQFDADGKIEASITGSPDQLENKNITTSGLASGDALVYDGSEWTNKAVPLFNSSGTLDISITGNAAQVAKKNIAVSSLSENQALVYDGTEWTNQDVALKNTSGLIVGSITGNAAQIGGITVETSGMSDGQVLVYRSATNRFVNENKSTIGAGAALSVQQDGTEIIGYDGSAAATLPMEAAVCMSESLPSVKPLHWVTPVA